MRNYDLSPDVLFMQRAMDLAVNGSGMVSPNPLVGSVIVYDGKIIGEGWHQKYGEAHAEVNAVKNVKDRSVLPESTVYVNLEPCSHFGKTPPCADMLASLPVKRVVISNADPNPLVEGKGVNKLMEAGIDVTIGVLEKEGRELNKRFFTMMEKKRPYIILKWAQTEDGFIARENYDSKWISNTYSRQLTHKWRTEEDAILVGTTTAEHDNPRLTVRDWTGRNPIRVVIDRDLRLKESLNLFNGETDTLRYNVLRDGVKDRVSSIKLPAENFLHNLIDDLYKRKISSLFVEGGSSTLNGFIATSYWDEARIFTSNQRFANGIPSPKINGQVYQKSSVLDDMLTILHPLS